MSQLRVGDRVQTVSAAGQVRYSEVSTFVNRDNSITGQYISIKTSINRTIVLSENHIIYARKNYNDKFTPMYAHQVKTSDHVLVPSEDALIPDRVIDVSTLMMEGAYVSLTAEGNIVVDGVLASCYASFDHDLAHFVMKPVQWFPEVLDWIFGLQNNCPGYVTTVKEFGRMMLSPQSLYEYKN